MVLGAHTFVLGKTKTLLQGTRIPLLRTFWHDFELIFSIIFHPNKITQREQ